MKYNDIRLPKAVQARRVAAVMARELTPLQRDTVARVMRGERQIDIARARGVHPATVCRTYQRGIERLQRFLRY